MYLILNLLKYYVLLLKIINTNLLIRHKLNIHLELLAYNNIHYSKNIMKNYLISL